MARRQIVECDLCKVEVDEDEGLFKLSVKKPKAKGPGQSYEICPECSEKLQQQLVSRNSLTHGWGFDAFVPGRPLGIPGEMYDAQEATESPREGRPLTENDRQLLHVRGREEARRRRQEQAEATDDGSEEVIRPPEQGEPTDTGLTDRPADMDRVRAARGDPQCPHYNKSQPRWGKIDEDGVVVEAMYQKCKECNATLRCRTKDQQAKLLSGRTGNADMSLKTHESETRKRT